MNCIIVDDEPLAREGLELKIKKLDFLNLKAILINGSEAYQYLMENQVDLMFLDIQMPDITGLELMKSLKNPPLVIFTTAYSQYALESYELDVVDYLVKPIELDRFFKAVNKAKTISDLSQSEDKATIESVHDDFLFVRADRQYVKIFFEEIIYIEGMKNYVIFHTVNAGKIITAMSLSLTLEKLPATDFARVNRSYIINVHQVRRIMIDFIILKTGLEIPFGKNYQESFVKNFVKKNLLER